MQGIKTLTKLQVFKNLIIINLILDESWQNGDL